MKNLSNYKQVCTTTSTGYECEFVELQRRELSWEVNVFLLMIFAAFCGFNYVLLKDGMRRYYR